MAATENKPAAGNSGWRLKTLAASLALALAPAASALDWRISPSLGATATFTDNARNSADGDEAFIFSVTPAVSLTAEGSRRIKASLNYRVTGTLRTDDSDRSDIFHGLGATGRAEVVDDFFFVDANATYTQSLISLFDSQADATSSTVNRANTGVIRVSPFVVQRFGNVATGQARYTAARSFFEDQVTSNANVNAFEASLASGAAFNDLSWNLAYSIRDANNRTAADSTFERASATVGYALTRKFRIFGTYGREWNDFVSANPDIDGDFYSLGFGWKPNQRTALEVSAGERYFGRTFSAAGSYRTRATTWSLRYAEDVSDVTEQLLRDSARIFFVCGGQLFETPDFSPPAGQSGCAGPFNGFQIAQVLSALGVPLSELVGLGLVSIGLNNGVFVSKSLNANVTWRIGPRTSFGASAFDTRRLFQNISGAEERTRGVSSTLSYRLTRHTDANGSLAYSRNSATAPLLGSARDDDLYTLALGLNHRFSRDLTGSLTFRRQQRESNNAASTFDENSLSASINMRF